MKGVSDLVVRAARPADAPRVAALLHAQGEPILGTTDPRVTGPVLRDVGRRGGLHAVVAERERHLVGAQVMVLGDARRHWLTLPLRHPLASARLAGARLPQLVRRARRVLGARRPAAASPAPAPTPTGGAPAVAAAPGPTLGPDQANSSALGGPDRAYTLIIVVAEAARGAGIGTALLAESLDLCRREGVVTYHAQITDSEQSAAMHRREGASFTPVGRAAQLARIDLGAERPT